jgi:N-methylhydantoinase A
VTSALGLLMADMRHDYVRTVLSLAGESAPGDLERRYRQMEDDALRQMRREGLASDSVILVRLADLRYLGQGFELEVPVAEGSLEAAQIDETVDRFHAAHKRRYGYAGTENPVEIVNLRLTALAELPHPRLAPERLNGTTNPSGPLKGHRDVYFDGGFVPTAVYDRQELGSGDVVTGPAIIEQLDSTTVVWPDQTARVDPYRNLVLERSRQR